MIRDFSQNWKIRPLCKESGFALIRSGRNFLNSWWRGRFNSIVFSLIAPHCFRLHANRPFTSWRIWFLLSKPPYSSCTVFQGGVEVQWEDLIIPSAPRSFQNADPNSARAGLADNNGWDVWTVGKEIFTPVTKLLFERFKFGNDDSI